MNQTLKSLSFGAAVGAALVAARFVVREFEILQPDSDLVMTALPLAVCLIFGWFERSNRTLLMLAFAAPAGIIGAIFLCDAAEHGLGMAMRWTFLNDIGTTARLAAAGAVVAGIALFFARAVATRLSNPTRLR